MPAKKKRKPARNSKADQGHLLRRVLVLEHIAKRFFSNELANVDKALADRIAAAIIKDFPFRGEELKKLLLLYMSDVVEGADKLRPKSTLQ